ncbi:glycosyltransferase family 39 protein [Methanoculleus sp. 7T]|jgi:mannosyltransferase|uniref:glycosyltransferase family 39 protein n=1 Tax=Methanoculleus sp. 7T TaxID=2937282 RepID=UPI0020C03B83|nr:glycosyltransferase family 39 protein [Methanoculleus sp. 7T]MCK8519510.1 glycosyltransferase family 39 protein [Methanoculleus sp. 7T]
MGRKQGKRTNRKADAHDGGDLDVDNTAPMSSDTFSFDTIVASVRSSRYLQVLIGLTFVGFLLRFYRLGWNSLWLDEASTLGFARQSLIGIWESTAGGEFNPPLFYWLEHGMLLFGDSEFMLRLLPALLGVLTIPVVYLIGKEFRDRNVGIIAAALLTFSPFHIFYSQEARAYAPMLFFFSLALLFYVRANRSNEVRSWVLFGVFSAVAFWMHFYAIVPVAVLIFHALVTSAGKIRSDVKCARNLAFSVIAFVVASLPLLIVTVNLFLVRTSSAPTFGMQGLDVIYQTLLQVSGFSDLILVPFIILFLLGVAYTWREDRDGALLLIFMMVLPLAASLVLSSRMPMIPRYLIYLLPAYFVGIASAYPMLYALVRDRRAVYLAIAAAVLISTPFLATYYTTPQKNDWRGFSAELAGVTGEGDLIVVLPPYMAQPLDYYYSNATDGTIELGATTGKDLEMIRDRYPDRRAFYVVTWDILAVDPTGDALGWLDKNAEFAGQRMGIYLFRSA